MRRVSRYVRTSVAVLSLATLITVLMISGFGLLSGLPANAQTNPTARSVFVELTPVGLTTSPGRVTFAENKGQLRSEFYYIAWRRGYEVMLTKEGLRFSLQQPYYLAEYHRQLEATISALSGGRFETPDPRTPLGTPVVIKYDEFQLQFAGINPNAVFVPEDQKEAVLAYYMPTVTAVDVHTYGRVRYSGAYQGIDILYYANDTWVHYDFHLAPQADPNQIKINFVGVNSLRLDTDGSLIVNFGNPPREVKHAIPFAYQVDKDMQQTQIAVAYKVDGQTLQFTVADYDTTLPIYIVPFYTVTLTPAMQ